MKVVLFCGGLGMRLRDYSDRVPKPLINIGVSPNPVARHEVLRPLRTPRFHSLPRLRCRRHQELLLELQRMPLQRLRPLPGREEPSVLASDINEWKITFVDTGIESNIGQRLKAAEKYLAGEDVFLANYGDGLTDAPLPAQLDQFRRHGKVASLLCVKPNLSYHFVSTDQYDLVENLTDVRESQVRINGGYFIFKKDIFTYIHEEKTCSTNPSNG